MNDIDEALYARRSERMLRDAGQRVGANLEIMVVERIWRERMPFDDQVDMRLFNRIERQGLMVLAQMRRELH